MHFDFSVPIKKQKQKTQKVNLKLYNTVVKNVYCVATIDINGNYKALRLDNGESLFITSRSYNIKTNQYYCQKLLNNKRLEIITLNNKKVFDVPWLHLPFAPGVGMIGDIVQSKFDGTGNRLMFDLTKTFKMPKDNEIAREAFLYFRDNYSEIYNNILIKYNVIESV